MWFEDILIYVHDRYSERTNSNSGGSKYLRAVNREMQIQTGFNNRNQTLAHNSRSIYTQPSPSESE